MNAIITESEYRKQLDRVAGRAFLFFGEEDYLKAFAIRQTRERLSPDPAFALFNDITVDALDFTPDKLLDAMSPPPMMSDARLILLRGFDFTRTNTWDLEGLLEALALLPEYDYNTVIVDVPNGMIEAGTAKRPSPLLKRLAEHFTPVHFPASTDARLTAWVGKHFAHRGVGVTQDTAAFLVAYAGRDMYLLASEIEKLACYALSHGERTVTREDTVKVAVPAQTVDTYAFSNAILDGKYADALAALAVMKFERVDPTFVLGELSRTLANMQAAKLLLDAGKGKGEIATALRLHEYQAGLIARAAGRTSHERLARAVALAAEADREVKRTYGDYSAIEKLICSL